MECIVQESDEGMPLPEPMLMTRQVWPPDKGNAQWQDSMQCYDRSFVVYVHLAGLVEDNLEKCHIAML